MSQQPPVSGPGTRYFSEHTVDLPTAKRYFVSRISGWLDRGYYAAAFGYACAREGRVEGYAGRDVEAYVRVVGGASLWPVGQHVDDWDLPTLLRAVGFYYRDIAEPTRHLDHTSYGCGTHPREWDGDLGRRLYRDVVNEVLTRLEPGLELTVEGWIEARTPDGLAQFLAILPSGSVGDRYAALIRGATSKFLRAASPTDQKDAVRDLADLLEELRPHARRLFGRPDEGALFDIANNFAIRHRNRQQRPDYDQSIWMPWIFYWYLAAAHALVTALEREGRP